MSMTNQINTLWGVFNQLDDIGVSVQAVGENISRKGLDVPGCWVSDKANGTADYINNIGISIAAIGRRVQSTKTSVANEIEYLKQLEVVNE